MDDWFSYILLVILIALSAFFSASETAYTTVNKIRLQNYVDAGSKKAKPPYLSQKTTTAL